MTKSEFIERVAVAKNIPITVAVKVVTEIFNSMAESLIKGKGVEVRGFGSFTVRQYVGHTGRNPKSGVKVKIAPKRMPFFKVGKDLRERILEG